jgi:hypothetical protein
MMMMMMMMMITKKPKIIMTTTAYFKRFGTETNNYIYDKIKSKTDSRNVCCYLLLTPEPFTFSAQTNSYKAMI